MSSERLSLQSPAGLPSPVASSFNHSTTTTETLISCFEHLNMCCGPCAALFPPPPDPRPSSKIGTREEQRRIYLGPKLSDRATGGPDAGPLIERFSCLFKHQYNCKTNPKGIVSLCVNCENESAHLRGVAENFLMEKECLDFFSNALRTAFLLSDLSYGDSLWGSRRINSALSSFYNDWFKPAEPVAAEHIITGVGCSAVLDQLFYTLMDEGEAILLAGPYYTGFDRDLIGRDRVRLIPVDVGINDKAFDPSSLDAFENALKDCKDQGIIVRAVIVCNPHNPMGRAYPRETLLAYAKFCETHDLHLVSDEIYAMSVYENPYNRELAKFTSMMSLDVERELGISFDKARVHVVHGMSKDFCANGLRVGALTSQHNPLLLRAMANTSMLMKISSPADVIFSSLLNDKPFLEEFISSNQRRLGEAHAYIRKWFNDRGVPVADTNAGHYAWVNLGARVGIQDVATEKQIFQKLLDGGVYIGPGSAFHHTVPGWFRVTFSVARDNLDVGLQHIEDLLDLKPL